jgi:hypothetical protein
MPNTEGEIDVPSKLVSQLSMASREKRTFPYFDQDATAISGMMQARCMVMGVF